MLHLSLVLRRTELTHQRWSAQLHAHQWLYITSQAHLFNQAVSAKAKILLILVLAYKKVLWIHIY
jgi:uncharacterized membrane protein YbaN (DUF454 family)